MFWNLCLNSTGYNKTKAKFLIKGFRKGFSMHYEGPTDRRDLSDNIPLTVGTKIELWNKVIKEVRARRYAGPYDDIPYENFIQSPIGLVPKQGNQTRLIFHLSYDFGPENRQASFNHHTPKDLCKVKYNDLDFAVRACLDLLKK